MTVHLISTDVELYKLCSEVLADIPDSGHSCTLLEVAPDAVWREADLHIWDFYLNLALPDHFNWNLMRDLFLVDRKDLPIFRERIETGEGNVLLKPVTRAALAIFLARAIHAFRAPLTALSGYCGLLASQTLGPLNETQKGGPAAHAE